MNVIDCSALFLSPKSQMSYFSTSGIFRYFILQAECRRIQGSNYDNAMRQNSYVVHKGKLSFKENTFALASFIFKNRSIVRKLLSYFEVAGTELLKY